MTRLELLEHVNKLNMQAQPDERFWTCTVLYNTIVWQYCADGVTVMYENYEGVPK